MFSKPESTLCSNNNRAKIYDPAAEDRGGINFWTDVRSSQQMFFHSTTIVTLNKTVGVPQGGDAFLHRGSPTAVKVVVPGASAS